MIVQWAAPPPEDNRRLKRWKLRLTRTVRLKRENLRRVERNQAVRRRKIPQNTILGLCTSQKDLNLQMIMIRENKQWFKTIYSFESYLESREGIGGEAGRTVIGKCNPCDSRRCTVKQRRLGTKAPRLEAFHFGRLKEVERTQYTTERKHAMAVPKLAFQA